MKGVLPYGGAKGALKLIKSVIDGQCAVQNASPISHLDYYSVPELLAELQWVFLACTIWRSLHDRERAGTEGREDQEGDNEEDDHQGDDEDASSNDEDAEEKGGGEEKEEVLGEETMERSSLNRPNPNPNAEAESEMASKREES